jgi:hypothetical protein
VWAFNSQESKEIAMSEDSKKVLEMLAEGKITSDQAAQLLEKLGRQDGERNPVVADTSGSHKSSVPKYLRVVVDSTDGDKVNIRIPLALVRTGIKLSTMLPSKASEKMKEQGIDLSALSELRGDEFLQALEELTVDVDSSNGDAVRIFCE